MSLPLEQYGLIGDCQTAALVGSDGSIDWLCLPRFDSQSCFAALLGTPDQGRWQLAPSETPRCSQRHYASETLVVETDVDTSTGKATVIDFMPPRSGEPDVIRIVVGREGVVRMRTELTLRFDYGTIVPWVRHTEHGIVAMAGPDSVVLRTPVPLHGEGLSTVGEFDVRPGERIPFVLTWYASYEALPAPIDAEESLHFTVDWWREWSKRCVRCNGPQDAVLRSLITLKALTYAPTGGMVAAPTSSLPEQIGGVRNWDYRYCWLRDATFTLYSLLAAGFDDEAVAWRDWLLRAVAGSPDKLQIMYSITGRRRLTELELRWLPGYENSTPVRIGNAASDQFQLDVYGEVCDMLHQCRREGLEWSDYAWRFEQHLLDFLESNWRNPDEGIWEVRGPRRNFTHSKVMAWVAFDRAVKAVEQFGFNGPADRWARLRDTIHLEVCQHGYNRDLDAFVQFYDGDTLDASLLMIPLVGFLPATDRKVTNTLEAIRARLMRNGFVDRYATEAYVDGLPTGEGSFLACSFWFADNLALAGRYAEAQEMFQRLLDVRNDLGLLSEEYDPVRRRLVGNFPQAFSHIGLVNTAYNLSQLQGPAEHRQQS